MATSGIVVTTTPKNVVSEASLTDGDKYWLQNTSIRHEMFLTEAAAAPTNLDNYSLYSVLLLPREWWGIEPESGMGWWVWVDSGEAKLTVQDGV